MNAWYLPLASVGNRSLTINHTVLLFLHHDMVGCCSGAGARTAAQHPHSGPAQVRYGEYFCSVLYSPVLRPPAEITRQLRQVVFSPMSKLDLSVCTDGSGVDGFWTGDVSPFLVVFQHGRRVWAGFAESRVRCL
jgi:hypothetical protein